MKKLAVLFVAALLTALLATSIYAYYTPVTAVKIDTPPTLDGVISEGEWGEPIYSAKTLEEILKVSDNSFLYSDWPEYIDTFKDMLKDPSLMPSALDVYMNWDEDFFYLALQMKVETRAAASYTQIGNEDCVYFNSMVDPYVWEQNSFHDYYTVNFTVHDDGDFIYTFQPFSGYDVNPTTTDGDWAGVRDENAKTTTYEFKFYWDELVETYVDTSVKVGDMFGVNLCICPKNFDGDPNGVACVVPAGVGTNGEQYNYAITLGEAGAAPAAPAETEAPAESETEAPLIVGDPLKNPPSAWALEEVNAAIAAGLVPAELQNGYTNGISRGQLALMLSSLLEKTGAALPTTGEAAFTDTTDANVLAAANLGIINGYKQDDGSFMFKPENTLKRSEMAAIINRVAKVLGAETTGFDAEVKFEDTAAHWCNSELGYPVHMGIVKGTSDTTFSPENTLTVEQTIMMVYRTFTALQK